MDFKMNLSKLAISIAKNPYHDIEEIQEFILDAPADEVRGSYRQIIQLCHTLTEELIKTRRSVAGINLLAKTISKIQFNVSQLTMIHADLCLLCLDAKCLNPAIKFLEVDYTDIRLSIENTDDVKQVMLFYYYGGLIYTAIKQFEKATLFFEVVLTMPANVMNSHMQESYKKLIILSLLTNGKLPDNLLPRYTSHCVFTQRKSVGGQYLKFAQEYPSLNYEKLRKLFTANSSVFERDENLGLMKQCLTQVHKRNIKRLTKTFLTLALRDVADHVGLSSEREAEEFILNMIDDGEIYATINQKDGMVVFQDSPETFDSVKVFQKLQEDMSTCTNLIQILRKLETESDLDRRNLTMKIINENQ